MKRFKFLALTAVVVSALVATFAFTTHTQKKALDRWYNFVGDATVKSSILNPDNYVITTSPITDNTNLYLQAIHVEISSEVYPSTDPDHPNKPKVDVVSSQLQDDILFATDIDNGRAAPQEIADRVLLKSTNN